MSYIFDKRTYDPVNFFLSKTGSKLNPEDRERLQRIRIAWNFYEGYHWEDVGEVEGPQVTVNYCKTFVNKFVSFEFGKGFVIKMMPEVENIDGENDPLDFLNKVWGYNEKDTKLLELGQSKSVTGDGWLHAYFTPKYIDGKRNTEFSDPFDEYEKGKITINILPSSICFPEYDELNKDKMLRFHIMFLMPIEKQNIFGRTKESFILYRQTWDTQSITEYHDEKQISNLPNKYEIIPFVHIKNHPLHGKNYGLSDIDDMIPVNTELNLKKSNMSDIIDYHSAPITLIFGARAHNLERGPNKVWGGLPKDAKVENLRLEGELDAAQKYISDTKQELLEIANIPVGALGGEMNISNTSAIALQIALMPLLEKIEDKHKLDREGLSKFNKILLLIGVKEKLITIPEGIKPKDFYHNDIVFESMLPKDVLMELQIGRAHV